MDQNCRTIALEFQHRISQGDVDGALSLASDDAVFVGPDGSAQDKAGLKALFDAIAPLMAGPFVQKVVGVTAEGERVAVQMIGSMKLQNGKTYDNRYHFLFIVRNGLIVEMTEYCDTKATSAFEG